MDNDCILPMFPQQQQPGKPQDYPHRKGTLAFPRHGEQCAARATPGTHPPIKATCLRQAQQPQGPQDALMAEAGT